MDPWDDINPYASRYENQVSNFGTSNRTHADQTSRGIWRQADKSNTRIHNLPSSSSFQGELSCSRSAQGQWGKTNNYIGGISCASTKNNRPLYTRRERRGRYWSQWRNEEVPLSDTYRKEESSYRFPGKNKNDCDSINNVAAERVSDLPAETRLACRRSLFDMDYKAETKLQARNYHSGGNHNNVAESKLKSSFSYNRLDHVDEIKSDYDNLPEIRLRERDRQDLRNCDYYSDKSDDDIDRLGSDYRSYEDNYVADIELAKRNDQLKKKRDCGPETQLQRRDDSPYKSHDLVVIKTEVEEQPDFEEALDYIAETGSEKGNFSPDSELAHQTIQLRLPSGGYRRLKKSDAIAIGLYDKKCDFATNVHSESDDSSDSNATGIVPSDFEETFDYTAETGSRKGNFSSDSKLAHQTIQLRLPSGGYRRLKKSDAIAIGLYDKKCDFATNVHSESDDSSDSNATGIVPSDLEETFDYTAETGSRKGNFSSDSELVHQTIQLRLPSGGYLRLKKSDAIAIGLHDKKCDLATNVHSERDDSSDSNATGIVPSDFEETFDNTVETGSRKGNFSPDLELAHQTIQLRLPSGGYRHLKKSDAIAIGLLDKKCDLATNVHSESDDSSDSNATGIVPSDFKETFDNTVETGSRKGNFGPDSELAHQTIQLRLPSGGYLRLKKSDAIAIGLYDKKCDFATNVHSESDDSSDSNATGIVPSDFEETFDYTVETGSRKRDWKHVVEPQFKKQNVDSDKIHSGWSLSLGERNFYSDYHLRNHELRLEEPDYSIASSHSYPKKSQLETKNNAYNRKQPEEKELVPGGPALSALSIPQASKVEEPPLPKKQSRRRRPQKTVRYSLPSGGRLCMKKFDAIALGLFGKKYDFATKIDSKTDNSSDSSTTIILPSGKSISLRKSDAIALGLFHENDEYESNVHSKSDDRSHSSTTVTVPSDFKEAFDYTAETGSRTRDLSPGSELIVESPLKKQNVDSDKTHKHSSWSLSLGERNGHPDSHLRNHEQRLEEHPTPERALRIREEEQPLEEPDYSIASSHSYQNGSQLEMKDNADDRKQPEKKELVPGGPALYALTIPQASNHLTRRRLARQTVRYPLPSGGWLRMKKSDSIALGLFGKKFDFATKIDSKTDNSSDSSTTIILPSGKSISLRKSDAIALGLFHENDEYESNVHSKSDDRSHSSTTVKVPSDFKEAFDYTAETGSRKRDLSPGSELIVESPLKKQNVDSDKTHKHSSWSLSLGERNGHPDSHLRNHEQRLEEHPTPERALRIREEEQPLEEPDYSIASSHSYQNGSQLEMKDNADDRKQPEKKELVPGGPALSALSIPQASNHQTRRRLARQTVRYPLPSGGWLRMKKSDSIALGLFGKKFDFATKIDSKTDNSSDSSTTIILPSGKSISLRKSDAIALGLFHEHDEDESNVHSKSHDCSHSSTTVIVPSDFKETFDYIAETGSTKRDLIPGSERVVEPLQKKQNVDSDKTHKHTSWSLSLGERNGHPDSHLRNHEQRVEEHPTPKRALRTREEEQPLEEPDYSIASSHSYQNGSQLEMKDNADDRKQPEKKELVPGGPALSALSIPQASNHRTRRRLARQTVRYALPSGGWLRMKKSDSIALGLDSKKYDFATKIDCKTDNSLDSSTTIVLPSGKSHCLRKSDAIALGLFHEHDEDESNVHCKSDDCSHSSTTVIVPSDFKETFDNIAELGSRKRDLSPGSERVVEPPLKKQNVDSDKTHKHTSWSLPLGERNGHPDSHLKNHEQRVEEHPTPKRALRIREEEQPLEEPDYSIASSHSYQNGSQLEMKDNADDRKQPEKKELVPGGLEEHPTPERELTIREEEEQHLKESDCSIPSSHSYQNESRLEMKDNADDRKQPEKEGLVLDGLEEHPMLERALKIKEDEEGQPLKEPDYRIASSHSYQNESQLEMKDNAVDKKQPEKEGLVLGGLEEHPMPKRALRIKEEEEQHLKEPDYSIDSSHSYQNESQLEMKDNADDKKQPEKKELVLGGLEEHPTPERELRIKEEEQHLKEPDYSIDSSHSYKNESRLEMKDNADDRKQPEKEELVLGGLEEHAMLERALKIKEDEEGQHLKEPDYSIASSHSYQNESQLEMKDNADDRKQPEKKELVPGGPALSALSIPQASNHRTRRRLARQTVRYALPSGGWLRMKKSDSIALGLDSKKYDFATKIDCKTDNSLDSSTTIVLPSGKSHCLRKSDAIALGLFHEHDEDESNVHCKSDDCSHSSTTVIVPSDFKETFDNIAELGSRKRDLSPGSERVVEPPLKKQNVDSDKTHKHTSWSLPLGERNGHPDSHLKNHEQRVEEHPTPKRALRIREEEQPLEEPDYSIASSHSYQNGSQLEMKDNADDRKQPEKKELVPGGLEEHPTPERELTIREEEEQHLKESDCSIPSSHSYQNESRLEMKDNADDRKQPEKEGLVLDGLEEHPMLERALKIKEDEEGQPLKEPDYRIASSHSYQNESQLEMKDNAVDKKQPEKEGLVLGGLEEHPMPKRALRIKEEEEQHLKEPDYSIDSSHSYQNESQLEMKDNADDKKQPEKKELVLGGLEEHPTPERELRIKEEEQHLKEPDYSIDSSHSYKNESRLEMKDNADDRKQPEKEELVLGGLEEHAMLERALKIKEDEEGQHLKEPDYSIASSHSYQNESQLEMKDNADDKKQPEKKELVLGGLEEHPTPERELRIKEDEAQHLKEPDCSIPSSHSYQNESRLEMKDNADDRKQPEKEELVLGGLDEHPMLEQALGIKEDEEQHLKEPYYNIASSHSYQNESQLEMKNNAVDKKQPEKKELVPGGLEEHPTPERALGLKENSI